MSAEQNVRDFLIENVGRSFCDDCLSALLKIQPRQQVQQKTSKLGKSPLFRRASGKCVRCKGDKLVIQTRNSTAHDDEDRTATSVIATQLEMPAGTPTQNPQLTLAEVKACEVIRGKDGALRNFLAGNALADPVEAVQWLSYLVGIKHALGNLNNDVSFVATLLVKKYLQQRFAITNFDAGGKAQGAGGLDVQATTADGKVIAGEIKTTRPYQPNFGAAQRMSILKDLARLASTEADHRLMFVIDPDAFEALSRKSYGLIAPGLEVIDFISGRTFVSASASAEAAAKFSP
jgi:hypothetical protein